MDLFAHVCLWQKILVWNSILIYHCHSPVLQRATCLWVQLNTVISLFWWRIRGECYIALFWIMFLTRECLFLITSGQRPAVNDSWGKRIIFRKFHSPNFNRSLRISFMRTPTIILLSWSLNQQSRGKFSQVRTSWDTITLEVMFTGTLWTAASECSLPWLIHPTCKSLEKYLSGLYQAIAGSLPPLATYRNYSLAICLSKQLIT